MSRVPYEKIKAECRQMVQEFQKDPKNYRFIIPDNQWNFYYHSNLGKCMALNLSVEMLDIALSRIRLCETSFLRDNVIRFRSIMHVKVVHKYGYMKYGSRLEELLLADGSWIHHPQPECRSQGRPDNDRMEICHYLLEHKNEIPFHADQLYFLALLEGDMVMVKELQCNVGNLHEYFEQLAKAEGYAWDRFNDYLYTHDPGKQEACLRRVVRRFRRSGDISVPDCFDFMKLKPDTYTLRVILKSPVKPSISREMLFEQLIRKGNQILLNLAAEKDWLGDTASLNLFVETARKQKAYQIEAWAMDDFRQRHDDAEVQQREEEEMFEKLLEDPYSPEALKREWEFECYEDHAVITRYQGSQTEVVVPCRVGNLPVTILSGTFNYQLASNQYREAQIEKILKVTVPEGVVRITGNAFFGLSSCHQINLPQSLEVMDDFFPFLLCWKLSQITIPPAVKRISEDVIKVNYRHSVIFEGNTEIIRLKECEDEHYAYDLVITAPKGSPAEKYAVQNRIRFWELESMQ